MIQEDERCHTSGSLARLACLWKKKVKAYFLLVGYHFEPDIFGIEAIA